MLAEGTRQQPIRFEPDSNQPWGVLALQGAGASGSRLAHCFFDGGSGFKGKLFEYSAMFSVHHAEDVQVSFCRFQNSQIVDDMVHAVYSEIQFQDCVFYRSLFDALDLDICKGSVTRCQFIESGNDGLDLMSADIAVQDCIFIKNKDKGISVGEGSRLLAVNALFQENLIGIEPKDGSLAVLYNVDFVGNNQAVHAYKKNWRYNNGGRIHIHKSYLDANTQAPAADKHSRILFYDSTVDASTLKKGVELLQGASTKKSRLPVSTGALKNLLLQEPIYRPAWKAANPKIRGSHGLNP